MIVDSFTRLEIVTTTRELYVEEAPEEFEVQAYDLHGNQFSSLEGLKFTWQFETIDAGQQRAVPAHSILRCGHSTAFYHLLPFVSLIQGMTQDHFSSIQEIVFCSIEFMGSFNCCVAVKWFLLPIF